jgi:hypothetical protein
MASAQTVGAFILFLFLMGLVWSGLYDTVNTTIPAISQGAVTSSPFTWYLIAYIWNIGCPIMALAAGLAIMSGRSLSNAIKVNVIVFCVWFFLIFAWAVLYVPINYTIPNAFAAGFNQSSNAGQYIKMYDNVTVFAMLGFALVGIVMTTGKIASVGGRPSRIQVIRQKEVVYRNKPKYDYKKEIYGYKSSGGYKEMGQTKTPRP